MKKFLFILVSVFNLSVALAATPVTQPLFYEIQKNGETAYMLGTMHLDIKLEDFPAYVTDKLAASKTVIIETNLDEVQGLAMSLYLKGPSQPLSQLLTPVQWQRLVDAFATVNITPAQLERSYPMMLLQQYIQIQVKNPNFRNSATAFLDGYVFDYAKANGKDLDFLEAAQVQFDIMKVTMEDARTLAEVLDIPTKGALYSWLMKMNAEQTKMMQDMNTAYYGGDLLSLEQLTTSGMDSSMKNMFLNERNRNWIAEFNRITSKPGTEFFAFGAGHLPGTEGVIDLLKLDGFTVTRVTQ